MTHRATVLSLDGPSWECKGYLGEEWLLRRATEPDTRDVHGWLPARVPGSVLDDVVRAGLAPDPKVDLQSLACEWVPQRTWVYRRRFEVERAGDRAVLAFEGIDHDAQVYVNGRWVGDHVGAFTPARFDVTRALQPGTNLLAVVIAPAPDAPTHFDRSDQARVLKSRMTYGWDFCPRIVHLGIWQSVTLTFPAAVTIEDVHARPRLDVETGHGRLTWDAELTAAAPGEGHLDVELRHDGEVVATDRVPVQLGGGEHRAAGVLDVAEPSRWWPNGYGDQPLYELHVRLTADGAEATATATTAFRDVELVANDGAPADARPYTFLVNGERILTQGWNWVPMDVHHGVPDDDRLDHLLGLAARSGANLLRVWGGGLIETDAFYERCDRLGLMVWQEFPLSSSLHGSVPSDDPVYVEQVLDDARSIVTGRRNHPSLVLWCGGNELDGADGRPADGSHPLLAGLEKVVSELDPDRVWLPTSPTGPTATFTHAAVDADPDALHDVHGPWEHQGLVGHHELYGRASSLLHSEFGVEGMANEATIEAYLSAEHHLPADRTNRHTVHRGDFWINTPLIEDTFGPIDDLRTLVRASQLLQADGLRTAIEANRRRMWRSSGSIPWQLNEPFPNVFCTSAIDHAGRAKPALYAVARAYADVTVMLALPTQAWAGRDRLVFDVSASSLRSAVPGARVEVALRGIDGATHQRAELPADLPRGAAQHIEQVAWSLPEAPLFWLDAALFDASDAERARTRRLCTTGSDLRPLRELPAAVLEIARPSPDRLEIHNVGPHVAVGVNLQDGRPVSAAGHVWFDAGDLTLFPGERRTVATGRVGPVDGTPPVFVDAWNTEPLTVV